MLCILVGMEAVLSCTEQGSVRARVRCRAAEVAPPPPPPGFPPGAESQAPLPQSMRAPARAPSGILEDGFRAPSSPMVDPEGGDCDRRGSALLPPGGGASFCVALEAAERARAGAALASCRLASRPVCILPFVDPEVGG